RWDWKWEERERASVSEQHPPAPGEPLEPSGRGLDPVFRRRRALAGATLVALVVAVLVLLASGGGHAQRPRPRPAGTQPVTETAPQRAKALQRAEEDAVERVLSYTPAVTSGGSSGDEVALTFDDGPGPYTQQLVAVLERLHVKATFFAIGKEERYFSAGTLAELRSGDVVGDHTETHPMMAELSRRDQQNELIEQIDRIEL